MASHDKDDFGADSPGRRAGEKRSCRDHDEEVDNESGPNKGKSKVEHSKPGATARLILSLRESLKNYEDNLATRQKELEDARSANQKLYSIYQNARGVPAGTLEPESIAKWVQNLKSSEKSLKEQLDKVKKNEARFIAKFAEQDQDIAELKSTLCDLKKQLRPPSMQTRRLLLDPAMHQEFTRLKSLVEEKERKIKELEDNVSAVNFTASSKVGKMLMDKCRTLQEENKEIEMTSEEKIHELEMKIAVLKSQNTELRRQVCALGKHMEGLLNKVDSSTKMVKLLQENLEAKHNQPRPSEMLAQREVKEEHEIKEEPKVKLLQESLEAKHNQPRPSEMLAQREVKEEHEIKEEPKVKEEPNDPDDIKEEHEENSMSKRSLNDL